MSGKRKRVDFRLTSRVSALANYLRHAECMGESSHPDWVVAKLIWSEMSARDRDNVPLNFDTIEAAHKAAVRGTLKVDTRTPAVYDGERRLF